MSKNTLVLYIHGKGGTAAEAEHYKKLFCGCDLAGLDYKSQTPWNAKLEFPTVFEKLAKGYDNVILIANSIGAYFSMCALPQEKIEKAYFISPVVDMEKLICNIMVWANVSEQNLREKGTIETAFGETLSWEYLSYVRSHPTHWNVPTEILYGAKDNLTDIETITAFANAISAGLTVMKNGEHWFHTAEQMAFLDKWIEKDLTVRKFRTLHNEENRQVEQEIEYIQKGENKMNNLDYKIRLEKKEDEREVENLVRESFWNVYRPGCYEHYVLHCFRKSADFISELDFVLEKDGKIIGQNVFVRAKIKADDGRIIPIATMGPICIAPEFKRQGWGKILLDYSLEAAKDFGIKALCFEGNIDFYGKSGFDFARKFGIRYHGLPEDADSSFFLCKELEKGYLDGITGEYATPECYFVDEKDVEEFDKTFPTKEKLKLKGQIFG